MKIISIFGTRPEMIKMWGTLKKLDEQNFDHIMVHTGQNFTPELKDFFFEDLDLRKPDYSLQIDVSNYGNEVADVIRKSDELFEAIKPDALLVLGDTYSGLSVMPAANRGIKIFHMEAGLRAWDKRMPEQRNRILIDHMSDILLPYNNYHRENLIKENMSEGLIFSGDVMYDSALHFGALSKEKISLIKWNLEEKEYALCTIHRAENTGDVEKLVNIFRNEIKIT